MTMTNRHHRKLLALALTLSCWLCATGVAAARTNVAVGLGDQSPAMFSADNYKALHLKKTRYYIRWDAIRHKDVMSNADAYVAAARKAHVRVLMHISTNNFTLKKAHLPSVSSYKKYVGRLVRHFRKQGVKEWGVWNEANHASQPTYRSPKRAAQFFRTMRGLCKGCTIVALDALDQAGVDRYIQRFFAALPRSYRHYARIIGIHNYSDTNRKRSSGTRKIIRTVKRYNRRADFWLTETGGVVEFGRSFPCNEARAANRVKYMFTLARRYRHDITRLYSYNWQGTDCSTRFDAGLVRADGSPRPGYTAFKDGLRSFTR
jgi:hypothetical protein